MGTATSQEEVSGNTAATTIAPVLAPVLTQPRWPKETDLIVSPTSKRIGLTLQTFLLRDVFYRTFDKIRASLLFSNSFPNAHDAPTLISEFLVSAAAESPEPGSVDVHERLLSDTEYMAQMHVLVSPLTPNIALLTIL
jgi:hypothetical protein